MRLQHPNDAPKMIGKTHIYMNGDTGLYELSVCLDAKNERIALKRAERIIKNYNKFLKKKRKKMEKKK